MAAGWNAGSEQRTARGQRGAGLLIELTARAKKQGHALQIHAAPQQIKGLARFFGVERARCSWTANREGVMRQIRFGGFALACAMTLAGCAHSPPDDPQDPLENVNRKVFWFNQKADRYVLKPVAQGYHDTLPGGVRRCIGNFFSNLFYPKTIVNDFLQVKFLQFGSDIGRLVVNSTAGIGGLFDVASDIGLSKHDEDFGQTLGYWGVGPGWFVMLPILGPSDNRDVVGLVGDFYTSPLTWLSYPDDTYVDLGLNGLYAIDKRASFLGSESLMNSQFDPYIFLRTAYLQQRENAVYDGHPPAESIEDDSGGGDADAAGACGQCSGTACQHAACARRQCHSTACQRAQHSASAGKLEGEIAQAAIAPTPHPPSRRHRPAALDCRLGAESAARLSKMEAADRGTAPAGKGCNERRIRGTVGLGGDRAGRMRGTALGPGARRRRARGSRPSAHRTAGPAPAPGRAASNSSNACS